MSRKFKKGDLIAAVNNLDIGKIFSIIEGNKNDSLKITLPIIFSRYKELKGKASFLSLAIQFNNLEFCRLLVEDGHSLNGNAEKYFKLNPLSFALHVQHIEIAELLIQLGADVNLINMDRNTYPLFWAIHDQHSFHMIDKIIAAGFPVNALVMRHERMTALQCAVLENKIEAVKTLLKHPVDFNSVNSSGETALVIAIRRNFLDIVKLLVKNGASLHSRISTLCPLFLAIRFEHIEMVELLLELGANLQEGWADTQIVPPLQFALNYLNIDIIMLLIAKGANVRAQERHSRETALHVAATYVGTKYKGETLKAMQLKVAKALIQKGADVDAKDIDGRTPLDGAIYGENTGLCKLLVRQGATVSGNGVINYGMLQNRFEYICCVSAFKSAELVKMCLERGGDYLYRDRHGLTPYHCVMAKHNPDMVRAFWQHGCPFDLPELIPGKMKEMLWYNPDSEDKRLLSLQAEFIDGIKSNRVDLVEKAIKMGAEPKGCSVKIPSTLHYVAANGNHKIAKILLEHGVAVNKVNNKGQTPLYVAMEKKNLQCCKVFLQNGACYDYQCKKLKNDHSMKALAEDGQLYPLFKIIYKCFSLVKKGDNKVLDVLNIHKKSGEQDILQVVMNCVNRKGLTLLATALEQGHASLAGDLMQFRVNNM